MLEDVLFQRLCLHPVVVGKIGPAQGGKITGGVEAVANEIQGGQEPFLFIALIGRIPDALFFKVLLHQLCQLLDIHGPQVMLVDGDQLGVGKKFGVAFLVVKNRVDLADPFQGKGLNQLLPAEDLLVGARVPAQQGQEVAQGPGDKTFLPVKLYGHNFTVAALGDFALLQVQGQRHMGKDRYRGVQGLVQ